MCMFGGGIQNSFGNKDSTSRYRSLCNCLWACRRFYGLFLWYFQNRMRMSSPYSGFHFFIVKRNEMFSSLFRIDLRQRTVELFFSLYKSLQEKLIPDWKSRTTQSWSQYRGPLSPFTECRKDKPNRHPPRSSL